MADNNELWFRIARDEYPTLSVHEIRDLRLEASIDYTFANESKLGQLYEQFVLMRTLSERPKE